MDDIERHVLTAVIAHHQRTKSNRCSCGWGVLGASFAAHIVDVYDSVIFHLRRPPTEAS
jgi:hypothetical protein